MKSKDHTYATIQLSLEGVRYWVVEEAGIKNHVEQIAKQEWDEEDFEVYGDDLYKAEWRLEVVETIAVRRNPELLANEHFQRDFQVRVEEQRKLQAAGAAIPPLILRGADLLLFDGYARHQALEERGIKRCLAYVGHRPSSGSPHPTRLRRIGSRSP